MTNETNRQQLFNYFSKEHGINLLDSEMNDVYSICIGHEEYVKMLNFVLKPESKEVNNSAESSAAALFYLTFSSINNFSQQSITKFAVKFSASENAKLRDENEINLKAIESLQNTHDNFIDECEEKDAEIERLREALDNITRITDPDNSTHEGIWRIANDSLTPKK